MSRPSSTSASSSETTLFASLLSSPKTTLAIVALGSSLLTAGAMWSVQSSHRSSRRRELERRAKRGVAGRIASLGGDGPSGEASTSTVGRAHTLSEKDPKKGQRDAIEKGGAHSHFRGHVQHWRGAEEQQEGEGDGDVSVDGGTPRYLMQSQHLPSSSSGHHSHHLSASISSQLHPLHFSASASSLSHLKGSSQRRQAGTSSNKAAKSYDESLIKEQLARHYSFLGDQGMRALREAFVVVVGMGGVGSMCALSLVRSGVGNIRIIDFDQVSLSSLNRHAVAQLCDVGMSKVSVCANHFAKIAPWVHVEAINQLFCAKDAEDLLGAASVQWDAKRPTYVVDCIDNLDTKVDLIAYCYRNGIRCFSSMGAGAKADPSRIQIADLNDTKEDPLSRHVRRRLRAMGIPKLPEKPTTGKRKEQVGKSEEQSAEVAKGKQSAGRKEDEKKAGSAAAKSDKKANDLVESSSASFSAQIDAAARSLSGTLSPRKKPFNDKENKSPPSAYPLPSPFALSSGERGADQGRVQERHMRRASSASSVGSANVGYWTPVGTPGTPGAVRVELDEEGLESLDEAEGKGVLEEEDGDTTLRGSDDEMDDQHQKEQEEAEGKVNKLRPSPSPPPFLTPDAAGAGERRRSSLKELNASPLLSPANQASSDRFATRNPLSRTASASTRTHPEASSFDSISRAVPASSSQQISDSLSSSTSNSNSKAHQYEKDAPIGIPVVFSTETKSDVGLLPLDQKEFERGNVEELAVLNDFRVRILPVLGPIPSMFGLAAATYVICEIAGRPQEPFASKPSRKMFERMSFDLEHSERKYPLQNSFAQQQRQQRSAGHSDKPATFEGGGREGKAEGQGPRRSWFSIEDVQYLYEEVFHQRSVVAPFETPSKPFLLRWDSTIPLAFNNVAVFSRDQAKRHMQEVLGKGTSPWEVWGDEAGEMFKRRMAEEQRMNLFR
ncbi:hypothetical protein IE81DRAFT_325572 [Ceraceosorus guamensis]|uniref:THIF-type NAD/FAD binding fold domain-containing protein n=1 Tax=Ceraceosorus guamensis TaxID=1522189 RepID=A0A316VS26_9BASI|nr:hypothetical protein IE81DRAFT_325572 [Ceraceosorus guamensis]PWN40406.1 hypothetical protein IE81DRAFT_325572 [Ceraceosorus guamensis]